METRSRSLIISTTSCQLKGCFVIPRPFRNSTIDSYFSDQIVFPRPIPISDNHSTDWSDDWFVSERQLPTAELWPQPRRPPPPPPPDTFSLQFLFSTWPFGNLGISITASASALTSASA